MCHQSAAYHLAPSVPPMPWSCHPQQLLSRLRPCRSIVATLPSGSSRPAADLGRPSRHPPTPGPIDPATSPSPFVYHYHHLAKGPRSSLEYRCSCFPRSDQIVSELVQSAAAAQPPLSSLPASSYRRMLSHGGHKHHSVAEAPEVVGSSLRCEEEIKGELKLGILVPESFSWHQRAIWGVLQRGYSYWSVGGDGTRIREDVRRGATWSLA